MAVLSHRQNTLLLACLATIAGCASGPRLRTRVASEQWYAAPARCGQGPYVVSAQSLGARWGEGVELVVRTPRRLRLTAAVYRDGEEIARVTRLVDPTPDTVRSATGPENQNCVASALEIDASLNPEEPPAEAAADPPEPDDPPAAAEPPPATTADPPVAVPPPAEAPVAPIREAGGAIELIAGAAVTTAQPALPVIGFSWPSVDAKQAPLPSGARLTIRFWSSLPNDFDGVTFALVQTTERPTVSDAEYEAHLRKRADKQRRREERARQKAAARADRRSRTHTSTRPATAAELEAQRRARQQEIDRAVLAERRRADRVRRQAERERRRGAYCEAHRDDTSCWGPGGFAVHADLLARRKERASYCAAHPDEARCWTAAEWRKRRSQWSERARAARQRPADPQGPPPTPLAEQPPPTPSENATWRPGYWHWTGDTWAWIAGLWRVPETDIQEERTTRAPAQPPATKPEAPPPPPAVSAVWTPGFWQWDGQVWVWIPGSWQLPPAARQVWRPARWIGRAGVFVLIPGAWITVDAARPPAD